MKARVTGGASSDQKARAMAGARLTRRIAKATVIVALGAPPTSPLPAVAQEDFRAADPDRPILVEDAVPLKLWEWELESGLRGGLAEEGSALEAIAELKAGLFPNAQLGFELEVGVEDGPGNAGSVGGVESAAVHLLYGLSRETWSWPAFAGRVDVISPGTGDFGREDWAFGLKGIATRSFGRTRAHLNVGYVVAADGDGGDYWRAGLAVDRPLALFSRAMLGDLYAEIPVDEGRTRVWAEVGSRWQVANMSVIDFGIATRLDEWEAGNANVSLIVGISRVFGIAGLTPVPPYPSPRID